MKDLMLEYKNNRQEGSIDLEDGKVLCVTIEQDTFGSSPRDWDNLGTMVCWHRNYTLGDEDVCKEFDDPEGFQEWAKETKAITLPLYLYDHSGISMSTSTRWPFNCPWDSGQVGWIYVTLEDVRKEYNVQRVSKKIRDVAIRSLSSEVEMYGQYIRGEVYGYTIEVTREETCPECKHVEKVISFEDSCWGFLGDPEGYILEEINRIVEQFDVEVEVE